MPGPEGGERTANPGSNEAREQGCICPVIDNERGRGYMGMPDVFVTRDDCPLHGEGLPNA